MGFSVTAAHVIFFVALTGAASAAMSAWWTNAEDLDEARRAAADRAERVAHGNMTLSVASCADGCVAGTREIVLDITNAGTTVIDHLELTYVIDGRSYTAADVSAAAITAPAAVATTDIILPGETLRVTLPAVLLSDDYTTATLPAQVVSLEGLVGRR